MAKQFTSLVSANFCKAQNAINLWFTDGETNTKITELHRVLAVEQRQN